MTDTPTPQAMTPAQRAELVGWLRKPYDCTHGDDVADMAVAANQLEADGVTIATLTAECDAAQTDLGIIIMSLPHGQNMRINGPVIGVKMLRKKYDAAQAEIARLTSALATAREDGMREAVDIARVEAAGLRAKSEAPLVGGPQQMRWVAGAIQSDNIANYIEAVITKGAAT